MSSHFASIDSSFTSRSPSTHSSPTGNLTITAIAAKNGTSTIERWRLSSSPFTTSTQAGISGASFASLGNVDRATYVVIPPGFDGGVHCAPAVQYVALLSGEAIISIPETGQSVRIEGGKDGLIIAADTKDVSVRGHRTVYPGAEQTVAISIPVREGRVPEHVVVEER